MQSNELTHLPASIRDALVNFDRDVANGTLHFTGEFADEPADTVGGWVGSHLTSHVSVMDIVPSDVL